MYNSPGVFSFCLLKKQLSSLCQVTFKAKQLCCRNHAILVYLASVFPGIADHWYPADVMKRAKVHSVLDWHHTNLRRAAHVVRASLAPKLGFPMNSSVAAEAEQTLAKSLLMVETFWLKGDGKFLLGGLEPSIADLSLVCEIMEMEFLEEKELGKILSPHKKVLEWIEATCTAANPHFDEVHEKLLQVKAKLNKQSSEEGSEGIWQLMSS
ncbi:glutathione transferase [Ranunculus cassubicifolius]